MAITIGIKAPDFSLPDENGQTVKLSSLKGKWVVLYFYPKDDTTGCTIEAQDFTKLASEFDALNAVILGVSRDDAKSHCDFRDKYTLKVRLLTDADHAVHEQYGAWTESGFMGRPGCIRSTVLIDPKGQVAHHWPKVNPIAHAHDVLETLKHVQTEEQKS